MNRFPSPYRAMGLNGHEVAAVNRQRKPKKHPKWGTYTASEVARTRHKFPEGSNRSAKLTPCQRCGKPKFAVEGMPCRA